MSIYTRNMHTGLPGTENCSFIFDIGTLFIDAPSTFPTRKISAMMLNRLDYLSNLTDGAVSVVSGGEISTMKQILRSVSKNLVLIGSYGAEIQFHGRDYSSQKPSEDIDEVRSEIKDVVAQLKPAYIENKKYGVAVHFGASPNLRSVIYDKLSNIANRLGTRFQVIEGHRHWELKEAKHNSGTAISELFKTPGFRRRTPYFFGQAITSESAFLTTNLQDGMSIFVGKPAPSTRAKYYLENSTAVSNWIKGLCQTQLVPPFAPPQTESGRIAA